ncbi:MAG: TatD family hydrolase [Verrucomicrobiales bacterium]|nr:TatD family hydrolase [Verrucomicrobiales bacterium]
MNYHGNLIDTHTHLSSSRFSGDVEGVVRRAADSKVSHLVAIACDIEDSEENLKLARQFPCVSPTVGIHPLYVHETEADWEAKLRRLSHEPGVAAVGEIGLDYFHPPQDGRTESEWRALQRSVFETQLQLALEMDLPVVIHQRQSASDVSEVLAGFTGVKAVLHCFTGTQREAELALAAGHYLSFTGIITFPSAGEVRDVAAAAPLDRIMVETDSPYLAPVPYRGKQCEPFMVAHTAARLAELHGLTPEEMAEITSSNACRFFKHLSA